MAPRENPYVTVAKILTAPPPRSHVSETTLEQALGGIREYGRGTRELWSPEQRFPVEALDYVLRTFLDYVDPKRSLFNDVSGSDWILKRRLIVGKLRSDDMIEVTLEAGIASTLDCDRPCLAVYFERYGRAADPETPLETLVLTADEPSEKRALSGGRPGAIIRGSVDRGQDIDFYLAVLDKEDCGVEHHARSMFEALMRVECLTGAIKAERR